MPTQINTIRTRFRRPRHPSPYTNLLYGGREVQARAPVQSRPEQRRQDEPRPQSIGDLLDVYRRVAGLRQTVGSSAPPLTIRSIRVPLWCIVRTKSHTDGLALAQLLFHLGGKVHDRDPVRGLPEPWYAVTAEQLARETGLSANAAAKSMARLRVGGWIGSVARKFAGRRMSHVWAGPEAQTMRAEAAADPDARLSAICVLPWAVAAARGSAVPGVLLSRLWWLLEMQAEAMLQGQATFAPLDPEYGWLPTSIRELSDDMAQVGRGLPPLWLSRNQLQYAAIFLRQAGFIRTGQHAFDGGRRASIWLDYERCCGAALAHSGWQPAEGVAELLAVPLRTEVRA